MASLPIQDRILHYFLAMGAQPKGAPKGAPDGLSLILGQDEVHVIILDDANLRGGKIIDSIMSLASLRDSTDQVYLAAPRLLGTALEADVFRSHGIGLILYDNRRIDEAVAPRTFPLRRSEFVTLSHSETLLDELAALKSMYSQMQRDVSELRDEVKAYQKRTNSISMAVPQGIPSMALSPQEPRYAGSSGELPSFFSNNPWLEVLSKRGREETSIAG